jgi:hypothetical protein
MHSSTYSPVPVLDAPLGLEDRVKAAIKQHDAFKAQAAARTVIKAPMAKTTAQPQRQKAQLGLKPKARKERKQPVAAVRLGWMAETAWPRLSQSEREHGLPLWRLAALANLKFVPTTETKLDSLQGNLMVFRLVKPGGDPAKNYGWAFVARGIAGMGQRFEGVKLFDHQGNVLVAIGHAPCSANEKISPFTAGIFEGPDEIPAGWVYRRASDKKPDEAMTAFISACLPLRQSL